MKLQECLPNLGREFLNEIEEHGVRKDYAAQDYVVQKGQIIRFLPIVMEGNVKVFSEETSMHFLLYYITAAETCIFSFAHIFDEKALEFSAKAETDSQLLLLPIQKVRNWITQYPSFGQMLLKGYQKHYNDLLETTKQIICFKLEERLLDYLQKKTSLAQSDLLKISHQEIADDLGTSREVISRLMKKLQLDGKVEQTGRKIKVT